MKRVLYLIPLYNKESVIEHTIKSLKKFSIDKPNSHFLIVENGSTDNSLLEVNKLINDDEKFSLIISKKGLGAAIKAGLKHISNNFDTCNSLLIITGADLPFGFSDYENCILQKDYGYTHIFLGSKSHKQTIINRKISRILFSKFFNFLLKILFKIKIGDTQGSFLIDLQNVNINKLIPTSIGFFATAEICIRAIQENYFISEIPVTQQYSIEDKSTVKIFQDTLGILREMFAFKSSFVNK